MSNVVLTHPREIIVGDEIIVGRRPAYVTGKCIRLGVVNVEIVRRTGGRGVYWLTEPVPRIRRSYL